MGELAASWLSSKEMEGKKNGLKLWLWKVWEISLKTVLKQAAGRGAFIDQSQSLNVYIADPNFGKMSLMHFYGWKFGLKTGMFYYNCPGHPVHCGQVKDCQCGHKGWLMDLTLLWTVFEDLFLLGVWVVLPLLQPGTWRQWRATWRLCSAASPPQLRHVQLI